MANYSSARINSATTVVVSAYGGTTLHAITIGVAGATASDRLSLYDHDATTGLPAPFLVLNASVLRDSLIVDRVCARGLVAALSAAGAAADATITYN